MAEMTNLDIVIRNLLRQHNTAVWHLADMAVFLVEEEQIPHTADCRICQKAVAEICNTGGIRAVPKPSIDQALASIAARIASTWTAVDLFVNNRDPHGVMDMGAELQSLYRARAELLRLKGIEI